MLVALRNFFAANELMLADGGMEGSGGGFGQQYPWRGGNQPAPAATSCGTRQHRMATELVGIAMLTTEDWFLPEACTLLASKECKM